MMTPDMEANRAALPKPPWYALGETLRARQARIFGGNPEYAFTCPKCHGHEFGTQCNAKDSSSWRVYCHHDICAWNGPYQEHVDNSVPAISPKALFAQLREMGVNCETCKNGEHSGYIYTFCGETDWLGEDFYCGKWEPTSPPTE